MCEEERQLQEDPVVDSRIGSAALTWMFAGRCCYGTIPC